MDVVVVYESVFGNTRVIAEAVADGLRGADPDARVAVLGVAEATPDRIGEAELVVVGGPTHMLGMSRASSRQKAMKSGDGATRDKEHHDKEHHEEEHHEEGAEGPGIREWLEALPKAPRGRRAAAFDTRLSNPLAGGAARSIARKLRRHGYDVVAKPEGFVVDGAEGPLRAGERDRANAWGAGLAPQAARRPGR
jgi:hypothetical protein